MLGWKGTLATPVPLSAARNMVRPKSEGDAGEKDRSFLVLVVFFVYPIWWRLSFQHISSFFCWPLVS
jgi:dipeptide/tripeptide permease